MDDIREVDVEDLLSRDPVAADKTLMQATLLGQSVLVTGAGGSIGSELCRQILRVGPATLVLFELSEAALYTIDKDLRALADKLDVHCEIVPLLGSVQDQDRMQAIMERFRVQTVYHAAAYKHVPIVEQNIVAGVRNNVVGTYTTAMAALKARVKTFVLVSTDKAVSPTSVMGASKRMAELEKDAHELGGGPRRRDEHRCVGHADIAHHRQLAQVLAEDADGLGVGRLLQLEADLRFQGHREQALPAVGNGHGHLGGGGSTHGRREDDEDDEDSVSGSESSEEELEIEREARELDEEGEEEEEHAEEEGGVQLDLDQTRFDLEGRWNFGGGVIRQTKLRAGYADYTHQELEGTEVGTRFDTDEFEGRLEATHAPLGSITGTWGIQYGNRSLKAEGEEAFIPETDTNAFAAFLYEEIPVNGVKDRFDGDQAGRTIVIRVVLGTD